MSPTVRFLIVVSGFQQQQGLTSEQYLKILPIVVVAGEEDARASAQPGLADGPLMVETKSVTTPRGPSSIGAIQLAKIRRILPSRIQLVDSGLENCAPPSNPSCMVRKNGVFLRLDSLVQQNDVLRVFLTTATTFRRFTSATCHRGLVLGLKKSPDKWLISDSTVVRTC